MPPAPIKNTEGVPMALINIDAGEGEPGPPQLSVHGTDTSVLQISEEERN